MDVELIKKYITKLQNTRKDDILTEELINFTLDVMSDFDKKDNEKKDGNLLIQEYAYLMIFFHKFAGKIYQNGVEADFSNSISNNNYNPSDRKVHFALSNMAVFKTSSIWNFFVVMHENRHALQDSFYQMKKEDILKLDPLAIIMLKEQFVLMNEPDLYKNNHSSFVIENDANLIADACIREFIEKYCNNNQKYLEQLRSRANYEKNNYASLIYNSPTLVSFDYENTSSETLPVFYENDRLMKKTKITPEIIERYPLLEFIYNSNGTTKTYHQLMNDKKDLIQKYGEKVVVVNKSSLSNYEDTKTSSNSHIDFIYSTIIKSDPLLQIEHFFINGMFNQIKILLLDCPQLLNIYESNIKSLFCRYLNMNNYSSITAIITSLKNQSLIESVEKRYFNLIKTEINKLFGIIIDNYVSVDSEELKSLSALNLEEVNIYSLIENKIQDNTLDERIGRQYKIAIHKMYEQYRKEINSMNLNENNIGNGISIPAYPEMFDLEDTDLFRDPLFAEYYKNSGMDIASVEEQQQFIEKYLELKQIDKNGNVEEIEFMDKPRGGRRG